jgi:hypothetical protein
MEAHADRAEALVGGCPRLMGPEGCVEIRRARFRADLVAVAAGVHFGTMAFSGIAMAVLAAVVQKQQRPSSGVNFTGNGLDYHW